MVDGNFVGRHRPVMLDHPFQRFPGQVQAVEARIGIFELGQDAKRLLVMAEAAIRLHHLGQALLARMAEAGMAEIVRQRHGFGQVFVEAERCG